MMYSVTADRCEKAVKIKKKHFFNFITHNRVWFACFGLPAIVLFAIHLGRGCFPFGEKSVLALDLNAQYIYYYEAFRKAVYSGHSMFYSWSQSLSGEMFGIFSYYLASPFTVVYLIFPENWIVPAVWAVLLLKAGTTGLTFGVYVKKRFCTDNIQTIILATLYALSAYCVVNTINPMWIDAVYMLPLIALGIDSLVEKNRCLLYSVSLFLAICFNYYLGYMLCVFSAFYFLYTLICKKRKGKPVTIILRFAAASVLAGLAAMAIILPTYFSLQNGKLDFSNPDYSLKLRFDFIDLLPKLLLDSYDSVNVNGLPMIYCGIPALLLAPAFFLADDIPIRKKAATGGLILIFFAVLNISILDIAMHGFRIPNWLNYRYSFFFSFTVLMASAEGLLHIQNVKRGSIIRTFGFLLVFIVLIQMRNVEYIDNFTSIWLSILLLSVYTIVLCFIRLPLRKASAQRTFAVIVAAEMSLNAALTIDAIHSEVYYSTYSSYSEFMENYRDIVAQLENYNGNVYGDKLYRIEKTRHRTVNDSMALDTKSLSHSTSTLNAGALEFLKLMGYNQRDHWSRYTTNTLAADSVLGIRYVITDPAISSPAMQQGWNAVMEVNGATIWENPYDFGIIYAVDSEFNSGFTKIYNTFSYQNLVIRNMLGDSSFKLFKEASSSHHSRNVTMTESSGYYCYSKNGENAAVTYLVTPSCSGPLYMGLSSTYKESCELYVNGEYICDVLGNVTPVCAYLGEFSQGEEITVELRPNESQFHIHNYDSFYTMDMDAWRNAFELLKQGKMQIDCFSDTHITGTIAVDTDKCVFTTIPYEKGWTILVDGEETEVECCLDSMICFDVTAGEHSIEMKYFTPGLKLGSAVSVCSITVFAIWMILRKKKGLYF